MLAAQGLHQEAWRGGVLHRQTDSQPGPQARRADAGGGGLDRGGDAAP